MTNRAIWLVAAAIAIPQTLIAQSVARLEARPTAVSLAIGDSVRLTVRALDAGGNAVDVPIRIGGARGRVEFADGFVKASEAGEFEIVAFAGDASNPIQLRVPVTVRWPAIARVQIDADFERLYIGAPLEHRATAYHGNGSTRPTPEVVWSSSDRSIAEVDAFGYVQAHRPGRVVISGNVEGVGGNVTYDVLPFPVASIALRGGGTDVVTGDVVHFEVDLRSTAGGAVVDVPVTWSLSYKPADGIVAPAAPGQVDNGKMVADVPGVYTVMANVGALAASQRLSVSARDVVRGVEVIGHGRQTTHYTSDVWPFEGVDGRDYAMTGSRQSESHAFMWDITDPTNIFKTDSFKLDARSVNDVKVSPNGRYGVISREGASNRRNGLVILDLANPAHPTIASIYDDGLTGGVHNVYAMDDYLFALSGGDKYVILDVRDLRNPRYVSEYNHPDSRIHDVWVRDGIAYSAEWETGVVVVDVGNGRWGGTIENPVFVRTIPIPSPATHAVFPYFQESTGKYYLFVGDEIVSRRGLAWEGNGPDHRQAYDPETGRGGYPRATSGYIQIIDITDLENAEMVARYEVSEYGTHNIWVEDDILYQAYYEGGVRMVDVSGELMGNLFTQGREIAVFKANDPIGWIPNSPAAWGAFPYKGNIIFSDISSGLWAIKLAPRERPVM